MTTTTFVRCLKRFSARRGLPRKIISDNAKTFKAAARLIKIIFNHKDIKDYLSHVGLNGHSILRRPHGGADSLREWSNLPKGVSER
jgi:hypothetical protein